MQRGHLLHDVLTCIYKINKGLIAWHRQDKTVCEGYIKIHHF